MKQDINSILLANWFVIKCKMNNSSSKKIKKARKYLLSEVQKAVHERLDYNEISNKVIIK
ncbi:MAG: hypothetical protein M0R46_12835 [Candidatus Muirbacterium halophilum]|nr:hypothetical protein [Candidatus Muirbacterium halophilum]